MKNNTQTGVDIDVEVSDEVEAAIKELLNNKIILWNDDVNSFDHVISCLMEYCKHAPEQAEQCATIVHFNGKCDIKSGSYEELEPIATVLLENGLSVTIE